MASSPPPVDLRELETNGLIRRVFEELEPEFQFRHNLIQEAAYAMLTRVQRKQLHRRVGETLVALYPDRVDEFADILARHFGAAGEIDAALTYSRRAARRAASTYAYDEACAQLEGALALLEGAGPHPERRLLLEELGDLLRACRLGGKAIVSFRAALAERQADADDPPAASLRLHRKILQTVIDIKWAVEAVEFRAAEQTGSASRRALIEGLLSARGAEADIETARQLTVLSIDAWRTLVPADWEAARAYAEEAYQIAEKMREPVEMSSALGALSQAYFGRGRLREHLETATRRLAITEASGFDDLRELTDSLREVGLSRLALGDPRGALPILDRAEDLARQISAVDQIVNALSLKAQCCLRLDQWDDVFSIEERWREVARLYTLEQTGATCFAVALSASARALRGERDQADALRDESYETMVTVSGREERWERNQHY